MTIFFRTQTWLALCLLVLTATTGCTVKNISKLQGYDKQITDISINIDATGNIRHEMKTISRYGVIQLNPLMKQHMAQVARSGLLVADAVLPQKFQQAFSARGIAVSPVKGSASTALTLTPTLVQSTNTNGMESHQIWYRVALRDNALQKVVWQGEFSFFVNPEPKNPTRISERSLDEFVDKVVKELTKSKLLKT